RAGGSHLPARAAPRLPGPAPATHVLLRARPAGYAIFRPRAVRVDRGVRVANGRDPRGTAGAAAVGGRQRTRLHRRGDRTPEPSRRPGGGELEGVLLLSSRR